MYQGIELVVFIISGTFRFFIMSVFLDMFFGVPTRFALPFRENTSRELQIRLITISMRKKYHSFRLSQRARASHHIQLGRGALPPPRHVIAPKLSPVPPQPLLYLHLHVR